MEWTWLTFLISLGGLVFGSTCNVLYLLGHHLDEASNWCPDHVEESVALAAIAAAGMLPALVVLNEDAAHRTNFSRYFDQFRRCALALFWLKSGGDVSAIFGLLAVESFVDLFMSLTFVAHGMIKNPALYTLLMKAATVATFLAAGHSREIWFLLGIALLRLLNWQEPTFADPVGTPQGYTSKLFQVLAPMLAAVLVAFSVSSEATLVLIVAFECLTSPVFAYSLPEKIGSGVVGATVHGTADLAMPSHRAAVVVGAIALASTASVGLNPAVISAYIYSQSTEDLAKLGLMFAFTKWAELLGPAVANKVHHETGSLLKTGLIAFWCSALAISPAILVFSIQGFKSGTKSDQGDAMWYSFGVKEIVLGSGCVLWAGAFSALIAVENRIVAEWSTAQDPVAEQRAMCAIAIMAAASANLLVLTSSLPEIHVVITATLFGLVSAVLGAAVYTIWFARNDRGPWRLVDGEGRELLRVTG